MELSFVVGEREYEIPKVINLHLFEKAMSWDITDIKNHKPFVATILDCDLNTINLLAAQTFEVLFGACLMQLNIANPEIKHTVENYKLKPFNELTFGEFVDIDVMLSEGLTIHASRLASIIYNAPIEEAEKFDINDTLGALINLSKFRAFVYKEHDEFFEASKGDSDDDESLSTSQMQYMWYEAILALADQQFLNISKVVERPYKEALNFLTWKKAQVARQQLEQLKRKNDLSRRTK